MKTNKKSLIQLFLDPILSSAGPAMLVAGLFAAYHFHLRNDQNLVWIAPGVISAAYALKRFQLSSIGNATRATTKEPEIESSFL